MKYRQKLYTKCFKMILNDECESFGINRNRHIKHFRSNEKTITDYKQ